MKLCVRNLLSEVARIVELILVFSASNAGSGPVSFLKKIQNHINEKPKFFFLLLMFLNLEVVVFPTNFEFGGKSYLRIFEVVNEEKLTKCTQVASISIFSLGNFNQFISYFLPIFLYEG